MKRTEVTNKLLSQLIEEEAEARTALQATIRSLSMSIQSGHQKLWREIYSVYPELKGMENFVQHDEDGKLSIYSLDDPVAVNSEGGTGNNLPSAVAPMQTIQVG